jgi:hypothetical protein
MSMHEWLITRGDVKGAPFEWRMQIYVPWNVVLVHEEICHQAVQYGHEGRMTCLQDVTNFYKISVLTDWLRNLSVELSIAHERLRWIKEWRPDA